MTTAIVISRDHWHAGLAGFMGQPEAQTPRLDALAATSTVFDGHFAEDVAETGIGRAWTSGRYGFPLAGRQGASFPVAEDLKQAGVTVQLVGETAVHWLDSVECDGVVRVEDGLADVALASIEEHLSRAPERSLLWIAAAGPDRFDQDGEGTGRREAALQDQADWDRDVGQWLDAVERLSGTTEVLLVVTGASGVRPGPREDLSAAASMLAQVSAQAPLLMRLAGGVVGQRRSELVQTVDLLPSLLEWLDVPGPLSALHGRSLLGLARGERVAWRDAVVLGEAAVAGAIRTAGFHLVVPAGRDDDPDARSLLFAKPDDLWDQMDLAGQAPEVVERLAKRLAATVAWIEGGGEGEPPSLFPGWSTGRA